MSPSGVDPTIPGSLVKPLEVSLDHSEHFVGILQQVRGSLLISSCQAGRLIGVGESGGVLDVSFNSFSRPMGLAVTNEWIALGAGPLVWFLHHIPEIAPHVAPSGKYDSCYLARSAHVTGEIDSHEIAYAGNQLWVLNTRFSCLCTLHLKLSFEPQWKPWFISALAPEDRCHLNGLAMVAGRPGYVTALGETDTPQGWRPGKARGGCLIDIAANATVARGFSMPHSPRFHQGRLWLLDSGTGRLLTVDPATGASETVVELPGYTRGLCFAGPFAFVGLSRIRPTSMFDDVPIGARKDQLKCGVAVVDLARGTLAAMLEFTAGVQELVSLEFLPGTRCPAISGPHVLQDSAQPIYAIPQEWLRPSR